MRLETLSGIPNARELLEEASGPGGVDPVRLVCRPAHRVPCNGDRDDQVARDPAEEVGAARVAEARSGVARRRLLREGEPRSEKVREALQGVAADPVERE